MPPFRDVSAKRSCSAGSRPPRAGRSRRGDLVSVPFVSSSSSSRQLHRSGRAGRPATTRPCGGRDAACRRPGRWPPATRNRASTRRTSCGCLGRSLESFRELLEPVSLSTGISRPLALTRAGSPSAARPPPDALGQLRVGRRTAPTLGPAPAQRASRSAARTDRPWRTIRRASRRRPPLSGTASTARACPSVSSPRSTMARMSSGSSSSRSRFEIAGFERRRGRRDRQARARTRPSAARRPAPPRPASAPRARRSRPGRAPARRGRPPRGQRRERRQSGLARRPPAALAGDQLVPAGRPRPHDDRLDDPLRADRLGEPAVDSWSKLFRGCRGLAWIWSTGYAPARTAAPPIRTSSPRPRPRGRRFCCARIHLRR